MSWIAGVDGCKGGWIAAIADLAGETPPVVRVVSAFRDLLSTTPTLIAVDMPIGLPDRIEGSGRGPEQLVRPLLGQRQSSVFSIPSRAAVEAQDYGEACRLALAASQPPRKVSKQGFHLFPRIREIDTLLRAEPHLRERIREVHPELAFATMNDGPLAHPKKIKGRVNEAGMAERRALLIAQGLSQETVRARPPRGAGADDMLDALAAFIVARHIAAGCGRPFPDPPGRDSHGIPIAIWSYAPIALRYRTLP